ncbi:MAG: ABC transporter permease subunit [Chromatiales bacterium]|jgi:oligopeptide transport system permease protein|nr:ABC transporter permease subunit [Chromatiales bacterium]
MASRPGALSPGPVTRALRGDIPASLWRQASRRFARNRAAMGSIVVLLLITVTSIAVPMFWPHGIEDASWEAILAPPSFADWHWFGTDANGRDLLVRVFYGGRISLAIGVLTTVVALLIGVTWGTVAGYLGGRIDGFMMRFVDILYALPLLFFIIILVTVFGRNIFLVFMAIGAVEWLTMSRIVRGQTLSVKAKEYVESAVAIGLPKPVILWRYIVPNVLGPVVVYVTLLIPTNIVVESYLSFLGLGVQEPLTSWGLLISQGAGQLDSAPWLIAFPATFLAVTMFCFNFIGDGLRDALDPRDR